MPRSRSTSSRRRRRRWLGVSRPTACPRAGRVVGSLSRPWMRATSSIRSASRCTSASRQGGTVTAIRAVLRRGAGSRAGRGCPPPARGRCARRAAAPCARAAARPSRGSIGLGIRVDRAGHEPGAGQLHHQPGGEPLAGHRELRMELLLEPRRRLRAEAELARGAHDVGPDPGGHLHQHPGRVVRDLGDLARPSPRRCRSAPPRRTPAPSGSRSVRSTSSSVVIFSPSFALRTTIRLPAHLVEVEGVHGLAGGRASRSW